MVMRANKDTQNVSSLTWHDFIVLLGELTDKPEPINVLWRMFLVQREGTVGKFRVGIGKT